MADRNQLRARLAVVVREFLAEEGLLVPPGEGTSSRFDALEEAAIEVGDALTRELLEQELAAEAAVECRCPTCGEAGLRKQERQRSIVTRRGPVPVTEIECYCRRCRRSFFPSVPGAGTGAGL